MNRGEWAQVCQRVAAWWPHRQWPDTSIAAYYDDLKDADAGHVLAAVQTVYRDGREWPPTGAQILQQLARLELDAPGFGKAWRLILRSVSKFGLVDETLALEWLEAQHPLTARLAREIGFREICMSEGGDTTFQAQCRGKWEALVLRGERDRTWAGIEGRGLPALRRVDDRRRLTA